MFDELLKIAASGGSGALITALVGLKLLNGRLDDISAILRDLQRRVARLERK